MFGLSEELKVKVNAEKDCIQKVSVEWPKEKVKEQIEIAFKSVQTQAKIPGFRPGKAPLELVRRQYQDVALSRAQDNMLKEGVSEAIKSKKINVVQTPVIQSVKFDPEKSFQFEFQVEVAPEIKLASYTGLKISRTIKNVTEDSISKTLKNIADSNAQLIDSLDGTVEGKHHVVVDYQGFLDGKAMDGGKAENFMIDMSAPQTISGIAEGLLGVKPGEEKDVDVAFPDSSPIKELAGKKAVFKVKVHAIKEKKVPELNDEFSKDLGFASLEELTSRVKANLQAEIDASSKRDVRKQISDVLLADNKFSVPPSFLIDQEKHIESQQRQTLIRQGLSGEDLEKVLSGAKAEREKQAEKDLRLSYVLNEIAKAESVVVDDVELEKRTTELLEQSHPSERKYIEQALRNGFKERLRSDMREDKVFDLIMSKAKIKDVQGGDK